MYIDKRHLSVNKFLVLIWKHILTNNRHSKVFFIFFCYFPKRLCLLKAFSIQTRP